MFKKDMTKVGPSTTVCRIFWPKKISKKDLYTKTGCRSVIELKKH